MSRSAVVEILQKIDALPERDRLRLERELASRADKEWKSLARQARARDRQSGVTQTTIDRAVEITRYGRR